MKSSIAQMAKYGGRGKFRKFVVGMQYEVELSVGDKFKATVIAYDTLPEPSVIIFEELQAKPGDPKITRMVTASSVTKLTFLAKQSEETLDTKKCWADLGGLEEKEALAVREIARIGVAVTKEAQSIFDELSKTFHVEWDKTDILVMKKVRICSPYWTNCVTGKSGDAILEMEVKRALKLGREKLGLSGK